MSSRITGVVLATLWTAPVASRAAAAELPDAVRESLEQNARQLGPMSIEWVSRATSAARIEDVAKELGWQPKVERLNGEIGYRMSWDAGRSFYSRTIRGSDETRVDCDAFEKLPGRGLYFPRKITCQIYSGHDETDAVVRATKVDGPAVTYAIEVLGLKTDPLPDDTFVLHYTDPGASAYIYDEANRQQAFIVQPDGSLALPPRARRATRPTSRSAP